MGLSARTGDGTGACDCGRIAIVGVGINTQRVEKLQTTGLYLLIFLFTLLWLTACSDQARIPVAEASATLRIPTAFEPPIRSA